MKRLLLLLGCSGALLGGADLEGVRSVYVMPMTRGMDQYLANRLANGGMFRVVADPKLADAIFTDAIGENFRTQLENLFPTPKPPEQEKPAEKEAEKPAEKPAEKEAKAPEAGTTVTVAASEKPADAAPVNKWDKVVTPAKRAHSEDKESPANPMIQDTVNKLETPVSTFGRGKGIIFLVNAKSRQVIWSTFDPSKGTLNRDLDRTASDIVSRLKKDMKAKMK